MFNREKVIETLVDDDIDYITNDKMGGLELLESYLKYGFKGYVDFTDEELIVECEQRDISYLFGDDNKLSDDWDCDPMDESETM